MKTASDKDGVSPGVVEVPVRNLVSYQNLSRDGKGEIFEKDGKLGERHVDDGAENWEEAADGVREDK